MEIIPVHIPDDVNDQFVRDTFTSFVNIVGLEGTEGTLKKYPGCVHWHVHKKGQSGTLEATWWPEKRRFWFSIHDNRRAEWQESLIYVFHVTNENFPEGVPQ